MTYLCGVGTPKSCPVFPGWPLGGCTRPDGCAGVSGGVIGLAPCNTSDANQLWQWVPNDANDNRDATGTHPHRDTRGDGAGTSTSGGGFVLPASASGDLSLGCVMDNVHHCAPGDALHLWEFDRTANQIWNGTKRPTLGGPPGVLQAQLHGTCVSVTPPLLTSVQAPVPGLAMATCGGGTTASARASGSTSTTHRAPLPEQAWEFLPTGQLRSVKLPEYCIAGSGSTSSTGNTTPGTVVSAYRIFDSDPITWQSNFTMRWRNGEMAPPGFPGMKCVAGDPGFPNGTAIGSPMPSLINSYAWLYEW